MTLGELHLEAMKLLVASLEKRKFAVTGRPPARKKAPRRRSESPSSKSGSANEDRIGTDANTRRRSETVTDTDVDTRRRGETDANTDINTRQRGETDVDTPQRSKTDANTDTRQRGRGETDVDTRQRGETDANTDTRQRGETDANTRQRGETDANTRQRGETDADTRQRATLRQRSRYVPAAERRAVYQRDAGRCTYVDVRGERCCETRGLELHHLLAFAKQGENVATNLTLRCRAHNTLAAEDDFGAKFVAQRRHATRHEALAAQNTATRGPAKG